ncbi:MAG TPA: ABC transporter permease [Chloroflexi bacterium]|nr:ABC transporter permease [Chloroflexota bacterium]
MDAVWLKVKADVLSRPLISLLILVTIVAASALFTLALATLLNLSAPYDRAFEKLNGAHLWLHFERDRVQRRDVERIEALPGVAGSTGIQYSVVSRVQVNDTRLWISLQVVPSGEMGPVNRLLIQEGRYLLPRQAELLAGSDLNEIHDVAVGDAIHVTNADGRKEALPVVGLAYNPTWDTYRNTQPPYLYVTEETLRELFPDESAWDWSVGLRLDDPQAVDGMLGRIESALSSDAIAEQTDWRDVRESAIFGAQLNLVFLGAFSLFAILATVLVITTSISARVLSQFRQIGILKAVGFTRGHILALYLGQYALLALIGSPVGLLVGVLLSPLPLKSVAASLSTTYRPPLNPLVLLLVVGAVSLVVLLATLGSAHRGAQANIVRAIATGAEAPCRKTFLGVELAARWGLPVPFILGLNDVSARPLRSALTGLNLTLGVMGIVFGLTLNETLRTYEREPSLLGIVYDAVVTRQETSDRHTRHRLENAPGVVAFYSEYLADAKTETGQSFQVRAVEGNLAAFPFHVTTGRFLRPHTHEAIAGQGLLDWLGVAVGDEITLTLDEHGRRPTMWTIVGAYPEPINAGQMMMVNWSTVERAVRPAEPRTYFLQLAPQEDPARLKQYLEPRPDADLNLVLVGQTLPDAVVYLQLAIFALAGILVGVAMINVFNTSLLAVQEKLRTVGVLKTLGMTPGQVVAMVNTTAGFLGLTAVLAGIPLGWLLTREMLLSLSRVYGLGQVKVTLNGLYALLLIPLMVLVSMVGSVIPGRQAARASIVKVLHSE